MNTLHSHVHGSKSSWRQNTHASAKTGLGALRHVMCPHGACSRSSWGQWPKGCEVSPTQAYSTGNLRTSGELLPGDLSDRRTPIIDFANSCASLIVVNKQPCTLAFSMQGALKWSAPNSQCIQLPWVGHQVLSIEICAELDVLGPLNMEVISSSNWWAVNYWTKLLHTKIAWKSDVEASKDIAPFQKAMSSSLHLFHFHPLSCTGFKTPWLHCTLGRRLGSTKFPFKLSQPVPLGPLGGWAIVFIVWDGIVWDP